ncbi:MAG TPA: class I SAM-dependent methyltransferase [Longimicrobiales bacterium]|nr:class I SAM-dependent methyltransferase [Longimicrobiales bacterium]
MASATPRPRLYGELADWWPLVSAPSDYAEEAAFYVDLLLGPDPPVDASLLELGSGGGNNASHMKAAFGEVTLVDASADMIEVSRALNTDCEHVVGDMRDIRLGRTFDRVFIHDAIDYMASREDLHAALATAFVHCRPGGAAVLVPDYVRESFAPSTRHGGHDDGSRGVRYLEWTRDPDPDDCTYTTDFAFLLREGDEVRVVHDRHVGGLFARREWLAMLRQAGFEAQVIEFRHSEVARPLDVFRARRPETDPSDAGGARAAGPTGDEEAWT